GCRGGVVADLDGAGLRGVAEQVAEPLQGAEMSVHGRRGREADGLPDLAHRGRVAAGAHLVVDEVEDRQLAIGEVPVGHDPTPERVFVWTVAPSLTGGKHLFVLVLTSNGCSWLTANRSSISQAPGYNGARRRHGRHRLSPPRRGAAAGRTPPQGGAAGRPPPPARVLAPPGRRPRRCRAGRARRP